MSENSRAYSKGYSAGSKRAAKTLDATFKWAAQHGKESEVVDALKEDLATALRKASLSDTPIQEPKDGQ